MKLKAIIPIIVLAFMTSFMFFIYEPIMMYTNNINDFWFDIYILFNSTIWGFIIVFCAISILFTLLFLLCHHIKKEKIYQIILFTSYLIIFYLYIHGNFLAGFLPILNGEPIDWQNMLIPNIISTILLILFIIAGIFIYKKIPMTKTIKYSCIFSAIIFIMLCVSIIPNLLKEGSLDKKEYITHATIKNIDSASSTQNLMVLLVDTVDSRMFDAVVKQNGKYNDTFKDFSYFPDTLSAYPLTRESIPMILTGQWYKNEQPFSEYSNSAYNNSPIINRMLNENYSVNIFDEYDVVWNDKKASNIDNFISSTSINTKELLKQETKFILFKYLPFPLKPFSKIENMDFAKTKQIEPNTAPIYAYDKNINYYDELVTNSIVPTEKKYFQFVHIEGGHAPFDIDGNMNIIDDNTGTYTMKLESTLTTIDTYIKRLQDADVYDNSAIIILSDHGYNYDDPMGRQNPILYIKGVGEHHDSMVYSEKAISYADLMEIYSELLDKKPSTDILKKFDNNRERFFLKYSFGEEYHKEEYVQYGKAWDLETFLPTGKEYNLQQ